jgi:hypothetical protein
MATVEESAALSRYWREQISHWEQSGQSRQAFCQQHDLNYHRFGYWYKKFNHPTQTKKRSDFVAVKREPEQSQSDLAIELPNGITVKGITQANILVVEQLLRQLR